MVQWGLARLIKSEQNNETGAGAAGFHLVNDEVGLGDFCRGASEVESRLTIYDLAFCCSTGP